jgi:hypothetical protein
VIMLRIQMAFGALAAACEEDMTRVNEFVALVHGPPVMYVKKGTEEGNLYEQLCEECAVQRVTASYRHGVGDKVTHVIVYDGSPVVVDSSLLAQLEGQYREIVKQERYEQATHEFVHHRDIFILLLLMAWEKNIPVERIKQMLLISGFSM